MFDLTGKTALVTGATGGIGAEIGSGKVLAGMAKRIAPDAESLSLNTPEDLEAFAKSLG